MPQHQNYTNQKNEPKADADALREDKNVLQQEESTKLTTDKYHAILNSIEDAFALCKLIRDENGNAVDFSYLEFNAAFEKQRQLPKEHFFERTALEVHPNLEPWWLQTYQKVVDTQESVNAERFFAGRWFEVRIFPFEDDCFSVVFRDITERKRARHLLHGQKQAFQSAMSGQPLSVSLEALVNTIVAQTNGEARAAFYMVPADNEGLHLVAGMSEAYAEEVKGFKVGSESLSCGLSMHTGEPVIIADVELEPSCEPFRPMARKYNFRACWSFPIHTAGSPVLGTFAMYFEQPRKPQSWELEMAGILAHTAAIIISRDKESAEHRHAEEALRNSEERYRREAARLQATLKSMSDAVYIGDTSGITLANQPALDQLGYSNYDELNRNIGTLSFEIQTRDASTDQLITPEHQAFARALAGEYVTQNVKVRHIKSGSEHIVRSAAAPVIVDGQVVAAVAVNTDITEQWQTGLALRQSEERLQLAINGANIFTWDVDPETGHTNYSSNFDKVIGFEISKISEKNFIHVHPDDERFVLQATEDALKNETPLDVEHRIINPKTKKEIWVRVQARMMQKADGKRSFIGITQNITKQKLAEAALRENEGKLREFNRILEQQVKNRTSELQESHRLLESIYNTTHVGMSVFKPVYNKRGKITDFEIIMVNKRIEDSSGRKDLVGKLYFQEFPGIKKMGLIDAMIKAIETGEASQVEYFYEHEGVSHWYSSMYIRNGNMLVCSNMDMTEQKQAEEQNRQLVQRQKELEDEQQQQIFRTILDTQEIERKRIAETLHNSLGQILYAAKLSLSAASKSPLTENDKDGLKNADKLLNDAIMESRRLSHELMPVILEDFGLKLAIEDICRKLSGKIQFKCHFKGAIKLLDKHIEAAIYRFVQELVMNIVKHSDAADALVFIEVHKTIVQVTVQDNGKGFNAVKEKRDGIGLKTIRNNVNLLKGNIDITSTHGQGTTISIDIPIKSNS